LDRQLDFPFSGSTAAKADTKDKAPIPPGSEPDLSLGPVVRLPGGVNLGCASWQSVAKARDACTSPADPTKPPTVAKA
jgi:hypothetical protein